MSDEFENGFTRVYKKYYNRVLSYCYGQCKDRYAATSITNDAFLLLNNKWDTVDFDDSSIAVYVWLTRTVDYKLKEYYRKNARHFVVESLDCCINDVSMMESDNDLCLESEEEKYCRCIELIKQRLDEKEAIIFVMLIVDNVKQEAAAQRLGISTAALKMRWRRMKPKIRTIICDLKESNEL